MNLKYLTRNNFVYSIGKLVCNTSHISHYFVLFAFFWSLMVSRVDLKITN